MTFSELKKFLDDKVEQFNTTDFLPDDPLGLVHRFDKKKDVEIMGLLMATIAWGNRKSIISSGKRLIEIFNNEPFEFVMNHRDEDFIKIHFVHRTFQKSDLQFFVGTLKQIYLNHDSLEDVFHEHEEIKGVKGRIVNFRNALLSYPHEKRTEKHIANPLKKSAAKRLNMYLRWMVRKDHTGVDFGIWNKIPVSDLYLPLDVHTSTVGRKLGLITRKQDDWQALEELMGNLREFDPKDPCKYDFALFGLGALESF